MSKTDMVSQQEKLMIKLYKAALKNRKIILPENLDWEVLTNIATIHSIIPFLYERIGAENIPEKYRLQWKNYTRAIIGKNYQLLGVTNYILETMKENNIDILLLKGAGVALLYPYPELRKAGDIDFILINPADRDRADEIMLSMGFYKAKNQIANHHIVYLSQTGTEVEIHVNLVEDFDDKYINQYLQKFQSRLPYHKKEVEFMGIKLPIMTDGYMAFHLLLHMLQHYMREGFGLRLLGDWVEFWNRDVKPASRQTYERHVKKCGLEGFSNMITSICHYYLGLENGPGELIPKEDCENYLRDILDSGEFGAMDNERMVVMKESGFQGYVSTFHHMTRLNYPQMSKVPILWPVLWTATFHKFLKNNKELDRPSVKEILKTANRRSKGVKDLKLFDRSNNRK